MFNGGIQGLGPGLTGSARSSLAGSCTILVLLESREGVILHLQGLSQDQLLLTETQTLQTAPARLVALFLGLSRRHDAFTAETEGTAVELLQAARTHGAAEDRLRTERTERTSV